MVKKNKSRKEEINNLWLEFSKNKESIELRNKLVDIYYDFVDKIAKKTAEKLMWKVKQDELRSSGFLGLFNALKSFDLSRNIKFETFAYNRVKGAMIDSIRSEDWVPRSVRQRSDKIVKEKNKIENISGKKASIREVLENLGIKEKEYSKKLSKFKIATNSSIENNLFDVGQEDESKKDLNVSLISKCQPPEFNLQEKETFNKLTCNFDKETRRIIYMHYCKNFKFKEIALKLGIKENKIGQIHRKFIENTKNSLRYV